jgi:hypothetical protein
MPESQIVELEEMAVPRHWLGKCVCVPMAVNAIFYVVCVI